MFQNSNFFFSYPLPPANSLVYARDSEKAKRETFKIDLSFFSFHTLCHLPMPSCMRVIPRRQKGRLSKSTCHFSSRALCRLPMPSCMRVIPRRQKGRLSKSTCHFLLLLAPSVACPCPRVCAWFREGSYAGRGMWEVKSSIQTGPLRGPIRLNYKFSQSSQLQINYLLPYNKFSSHKKFLLKFFLMIKLFS